MLSLTPDKQTLRQKPLWGIKKVTKYSKSLNSFSLEENILNWMNLGYKQNSFKTIKQKYRTYRENKRMYSTGGDLNKPLNY